MVKSGGTGSMENTESGSGKVRIEIPKREDVLAGRVEQKPPKPRRRIMQFNLMAHHDDDEDS